MTRIVTYEFILFFILQCSGHYQWTYFTVILPPTVWDFWRSYVIPNWMVVSAFSWDFYICFYTPAQRSWRGVYWIHLVRPSIHLSVHPSVCRRHGFRSISLVCFGISISNFICMLMVAIGRSLLIFSNVTFKMAVWWPYWIFWFPDSNFTLALNIIFKLQRHNTYVYG